MSWFLLEPFFQLNCGELACHQSYSEELTFSIPKAVGLFIPHPALAFRRRNPIFVVIMVYTVSGLLEGIRSDSF